MSIIGWVVIGGIAGWLASIIMKRNEQMGCLANVIVGILGGLIGGWLMSSVFGSEGFTGFNLPSLLVALVGSVILLAIWNMIAGRRVR